jgi:NitT/TauT family transport system permease protein
MNSEVGRKLASAAFIVGLFVLWEAICLIFHVSDVIVPRPSQVFVTMWEKAPALWPHTLQTLYTTMVGFVLGVAIGVVIGVIVGWSKLAYDIAYPLLVGFSAPSRPSSPR